MERSTMLILALLAVLFVAQYETVRRVSAVQKETDEMDRRLGRIGSDLDYMVARLSYIDSKLETDESNSTQYSIKRHPLPEKVRHDWCVVKNETKILRGNATITDSQGQTYAATSRIKVHPAVCQFDSRNEAVQFLREPNFRILFKEMKKPR